MGDKVRGVVAVMASVAAVRGCAPFTLKAFVRLSAVRLAGSGA